ncbi:flagellar assembly peptidoglycan hydrolase FlgJ [Aquimonas sp.]|jgi:flagellar protein FlgJ|uniref:flagellar assembly peptidoglycan hydrolase FlgJ n=1 Tax=Aquimonas sp. TaxID=1872588 RepID=UPI0037C0DF09
MNFSTPDLALMNRLAVSAPAAAAPKTGAAAGDVTADTARKFEALFVEQMLKTMRESAGGEALFPGQSGLFREMHDREVVQSISNGAGFGLASQIERSLRQQQAALEGGVSSDAGAVRAPTGVAYPLDGYARLLPAQRFERATASGGSVGSTPLPVPRLPEPAGASRPAAADLPVSAPSGIKPVDRSAPPVPSARLVSAADSLTQTPEQFVERVWPHAQKAAAELGVDPRVLVAQAALETGWGRHVPRASDGSAGHNLFGIKAGRSWEGERASHATQEFTNGRMQAERADFRTYDSVEQSFNDYVALVRGNPRYAPALAVAGNSGAYASALQRAGYATDPQYAQKLTAIAHGPRLNRALAALAPAESDPQAPRTLLAQNLQQPGATAAARG